jgi:hypothetical protein
MTAPQDVQLFIDRTAVDSEGNKIGQVYLDERSGLPLWGTVATGMLGTRQSFAPIYGSRFDGEQVTLTVSKDLGQGRPEHRRRRADRRQRAGSPLPALCRLPRQRPGSRADGGTATAASWPTAPPELRAGTLRVRSPMTR